MSDSNSDASIPNVMIQCYIAADKVARAEEFILEIAEQVRLNEPWISLYRWYRMKSGVDAACISPNSVGSCKLAFVISIVKNVFLELTCASSIDDVSKLGTRPNMPHHQALGKVIREENLLREPLKYSILENMGFWMR